MRGIPFFFVDVFAGEKYAGNPLAVFRSGRTLSDAEMQRIAREINFSETTFILSEKTADGGYPVRIFTPGREIPFAGHPSLGTAYIIKKEILGGKADRILLNFKAGLIPVTFQKTGDGGEICWMEQMEPAFGRNFPPEILAGVLGLERSEIDDRFPVEEVSTGLPHIILPLKTLSSLQRIRVQREAYSALMHSAGDISLLAFCAESRDPRNSLSVRVFDDCFGIPEDPATGSGNGCLAGYLVRHRYFGGTQIDLRSEQGCEIGRPSLLHLRAGGRAEGIRISVGGRVIPVARGEWD